MSTPSSPSSDSAVDQVLTQQARPSRRAGKKAMEEMSRETQRMARNMHLQHQAITKKKITMQSLLDRFNFKPSAEEGSLLPTPPATSSILKSDVEVVRSTELSSPPTFCDLSDRIDLNRHEDGDRACGNGHIPENAQPIEEYVPPAVPVAVAATLPSTLLGLLQRDHVDQNSEADVSRRASEQVQVERLKRVLNRPWLRRTHVPRYSPNLDSDSELEIIPVSKAKAALSAHIPVGKENESHSLLVLRACAQLNQPDERAPHLAKGSMTLPEMQAMLRRRARKQGTSERLEYLDELRKRGIVPQTAEEIAREEATIEMLVEKARLEAEAIQKQEKASAKKEGKEGSDEGFLDDSSDHEEAEWDGELELSGSEEDNLADDEDTGDVETEEDEDADELANAGSQLTAAAEATPEARQCLLVPDGAFKIIANHESDVDAQSDGQLTTFVMRPSRRVRQVISDEEEISTSPPSTVQVPVSVKKPDVQMVSFGPKPVLGLTQLFSGTVTQDQTVDSLSGPDTVQQPKDRLDFLRQPSVPSLPYLIDDIVQAQSVPQEEVVIRDSHPLPWGANGLLKSSSGELYDVSPSPEPIDMFSAPQALPSPTQMLDIPDPTQDVGFSNLGYVESPGRLFTPLGTVETLLSRSHQVSPTKKSATRRLVKRNGERLRRRARASSESDAADGDESDIDGASDEREHMGSSASTDHVLLKGTITANASEEPMFDKRKSHVKELVDEHAQESEDEYAGLGGASDDDNRSDNEDEDMSDLLDDEAQDVDEQELAALMANKNRADDKRRFEQLYNDVTTGALRHRRGGELDLSDSDYDEDARRRIKRREESKMRRALLAADENVGKIATNPKKSAFFRSIEDRDEELDMDEDIDEPTVFLDEPSVDRVFSIQEGDNVGSTTRPNDSPGNHTRQKNNSRKRPREDLSDDENSPPRTLGRPKNHPALTMLTSAADVRATLSAMLAPPNAVVFGPSCMNPDNDEDDDEEDDDEKQTHEPSSSANYGVGKRFGTKGSSNVVNPFSLARQALAARQDQRDICEDVDDAGKKRSQVIDRLAVRQQSANIRKTRGASDGPRLAFFGLSSLLTSDVVAPGHVGARGGTRTSTRTSTRLLASFQSSTRTPG